MNIYDGGYIFENVSNEYISQVSREVYLNSMLSLGTTELTAYFKGTTVIPVFRLFVLKDDETVDYEISRDVVSANLNINYQSGKRRTMNVVLSNESGHWAYGSHNTLFEGMLVRLDCGVVIKDTLYWQQQGVFLLQEPSFSVQDSNKTISLEFCDKWGLWDGSVYGNTQFKTIVPQGVSIRQVFNTYLHEDNGTNKMWDIKACRFNSDYWNTNTFYTIKQDAGQTKSEVLLNMAKTISSDVYYDAKGHCVVESNVLEFINNNFPVVWSFKEGDTDCSSPSLKYNRSKYYNKITTKGNIVNGYQFSATVENKNRKSLYNTIDCPIIPKVNNNTKLYSDNLCLEQSMKEMIDQSRGLLSVTMTTGYLPFLDINQAIWLDFPSLNLMRSLYIIDSISYNISSQCIMNLSLTSINELVF